MIVTKLIYCTFEKDDKENSPEDMTDHETESTSTCRSMECDVEMHSQEDNEQGSVQISESNSYFCK